MRIFGTIKDAKKEMPVSDAKISLFIRDREQMGEREAFHKLHGIVEEALNKTKYFKSYTG